MIEELSNYAVAVICAYFIMNIVQMLLPDNTNKKYIIFICGAIITLIIVNPIIKILNKDFNLQKIFTLNQEEYIDLEKNYEQKYNDDIIYKYKKNIEDSIIKRLNDAGYTIHNIECEYDANTLEPSALKLNLETSSGDVLPVKIEVSSSNSRKSDLSFAEIINIKKILREEYGINSVEIN